MDYPICKIGNLGFAQVEFFTPLLHVIVIDKLNLVIVGDQYIYLMYNLKCIYCMFGNYCDFVNMTLSIPCSSPKLFGYLIKKSCTRLCSLLVFPFNKIFLRFSNKKLIPKFCDPILYLNIGLRYTKFTPIKRTYKK